MHAPRFKIKIRVAIAGLAMLLCIASKSQATDEISFAQVRGILSDHCFECHGPDEATREADLRLDQFESAQHVLHADTHGVSALQARIQSTDPDAQMPPPDSLKPLTDEEKETLTQWIASGASYEEHWAFRLPEKPKIPPGSLNRWSKNPIDRFVALKFAERKLAPSAPASVHALARRISLDLTGLPIETFALEGFLGSASLEGLEIACQRLIDDLMSSPAYAEHMALPWLEASRYADTDGYQNDRYRYQHAWRDWVIRAFDQKMPYDQFVIEQIAGDMLPDATLWQQVASGFGRNHRINSEDGSIPEEWRVENVADRVDTFGTVFLGMTIGCARCHDHKYDPISQKEYYQLFAYFNSIAEHGVGPNNGNSPPFIELPASWPNLSEADNHFITPEPVKLKRARKEAGNGLERPQPGSPKTVMVMHELAEPRKTFRLIRGRYNMPDQSEALQPAVPKALHDLSQPMPATRLELAEWLVNGRNPLAARVAVNRLWQEFFGQGLVASAENLGSQGSLPSHPELLDWLAFELMENDWSLQHIQRLILTSATYQQESQLESSATFEKDPSNEWLSRGPRQRLSAFSLRDQALASAGLLVRKFGGESVKPYMPEKIWSAFSNNKYVQDSGEKLFRRSLYTYWRRTIPPPTMVNFNAAAREVCIVRNELTNTPLQALTLLNNKTFVEAARCLAERMLVEGGSQFASQVDYGYRRLLARSATNDEVRLLSEAHRAFKQQLHSQEKSAAEILALGESQRNKELDEIEHATMTLVASLILNLDETVTKQ